VKEFLLPLILAILISAVFRALRVSTSSEKCLAAQAEAAVASEMKSPLRDETTDKDTHYEWAKSELERAQVQLKALQSRQAETGVQEASYRTMARSLGDNAVAQDDLQNTEKAAEESYLLFVKKQEQARMADALDQSGIVNVAMAESPVVPALPASSAPLVLSHSIPLYDHKCRR